MPAHRKASIDFSPEAMRDAERASPVPHMSLRSPRGPKSARSPASNRRPRVDAGQTSPDLPRRPQFCPGRVPANTRPHMPIRRRLALRANPVYTAGAEPMPWTMEDRGGTDTIGGRAARAVRRRQGVRRDRAVRTDRRRRALRGGSGTSGQRPHRRSRSRRTGCGREGPFQRRRDVPRPGRSRAGQSGVTVRGAEPGQPDRDALVRHGAVRSDADRRDHARGRLSARARVVHRVVRMAVGRPASVGAHGASRARRPPREARPRGPDATAYPARPADRHLRADRPPRRFRRQPRTHSGHRSRRPGRRAVGARAPVRRPDANFARRLGIRPSTRR